MGVNLTPIIVKQTLRLDDLRGKRLAVDANAYLYQFLALIRTPDGTPLQDAQGRITSHLTGLIYRTTRLIHDYRIHPVFVFDGRPPRLKRPQLMRRRAVRAKATREWRAAVDAGDVATAFSKAVMTSRLTRTMVDEARRVLAFLGIPSVQAPSEAEAQAAYMAAQGAVWSASSKDYDTLLFGTPRLVRFLTISGTEYLPSRGVARPLQPELIDLQAFLQHHGLTREQLLDVAILIGTDFNPGVKGLGPKRSLKLIQTHGALEHLPSTVRAQLTGDVQAVRRLFLHPATTDVYAVEYDALDAAALYRFLCDERDFSRPRVETAVRRMRAFYDDTQTGLDAWLD
jgi:flap endonuclease-1